MPARPGARALRLTLLALLALLQPLGAGTATLAQTSDAARLAAGTPATYIVQLKGAPIAVTAGIPQRPARALAPDLRSRQALARAAELGAQRARVLGAVQQAIGGAVTPSYVYEAAYNGVALTLTPAQAARVAKLPEVLHIEREQAYDLDTDAGPAWIGAGSVWDGSAGGVYAATLLGANVAPPVATSGGGRATLSFDSATSTLSYSVSVKGLGEAIAEARLSRTSDGSVVTLLAAGGAPGSYAGSVALPPADVTRLTGGDLAIVITTATYPGGALRGAVAGYQGEGVVVGIIDSGINTTHPSFAAVGGDGYRHLNPLGPGVYRGACDPTNLPSVASGNPSGYNPAIVCNDKLIGAWTFADTAPVASPAGEPSPNDSNGHGSHTASTVAGNVVLGAPLGGATIPRASGVAPHANIIAYDVCGYLVSGSYSASCPGAALLAAIDRATKDQVDVINYSISGSASPWADAIEQAFLGARAAGVVVSTSAGNSGPAASTVAHVSPWLLSVAATTHNRHLENRVTNLSASVGGTLPSISGAGMSGGLPSDTPIVYAGSGAVGNALCGPFTTPQAAAVAGKIVICDRGTYGRVEKAQNVAAAGGVGFILANNAASGSSLVADPFPIPGIHITYDDGVTLKAWVAASTSPVGRISGTTRVLDSAFGDIMASFSSRGPVVSEADTMLKPDLAAPGVDVFAAYANDGAGGPDYTLLSGTSMASPHVAGSAALLVGLHPDWTPGQVQSALTTTATSAVLKEDGATAATPFDSGAGRVQVNRAAVAGLVLDETVASYQAADPASGGDPSALNTVAMQAPVCVLSCSWTRTVRSTLGAPATWTASGTSGVTVSPPSFSIPAGGTQTFTVTFDVTGKALGAYAFGRVTLSASGGVAPDAALPIAARPAVSTLPTDLTERGPAGVATFQEPFRSVAYGALTVSRSGLAKGSAATLTIAEGGQSSLKVAVPASTRRLVAEVTASTSRDADLAIYRDDGNGALDTAVDTKVCESASSIVLEHCNVDSPAAGDYFIQLVNYEASAPGASDPITFVTAVVPAASSDNFTVSLPASSAGGSTTMGLSVNLPTSQLGDRWYGAFELKDGATSLGVARFDFHHEAGPPASVTVSGGSGQSALVGSAFAAPLRVQVKDSVGNPLSGVTVSFSAPGSGATAALSAPSAVTDAGGYASVTATAGPLAGVYQVTAAASGAGATFALTNRVEVGLPLVVQPGSPPAQGG